jgi:CheY-like chemotaxis protein
MNGYEVCRRIREQPWGGDLLMVALTGWGQEEDRHKSSEAGFDVHIVKPADPDVLAKVLTSRRAPEEGLVGDRGQTHV